MNNINDLKEGLIEELSEGVNAMIKEVVSERISQLKSDTRYTVKQIFGDHWGMFEVQFRRDIGGAVSKLVKQQALPLKQVGVNTANSNLYTIIRN